ncbi:MAG TPA: ABC transporter substrate-binding protein [Roseiflexaceae bacterium]|nr:ABC transporter substrate-binding protein [Roseiflexaceae bacterium]
MKSVMHRRTWRGGLLLALVALTLGACGGGQQPGQGNVDVLPTAPGLPTTNDATAPAGTAPGQQPNSAISGSITFWHFWGSPVRRNAIRRVIALCAGNPQAELPNLQVEEVFKPFGDIWTANIAAVAAGSGMPDVIVEDRPVLAQRAADGVDQSLQAFAQRDGVDGAAFWPFTWQQTLYQGETYGIPWETDARVLYWNKNAFTAAGLDPEKPPTTWDQIQEYADKLDQKNPDGSYARIGFFPLINTGADIWTYTNGGEWVNAEGQPVLNSPQNVETLAWVKQWVDRYGGWESIQKFRAQFAAPPQDPFMSGKVAMIVDIPGYSSQLNFYRPRVSAAEGATEELLWGVSGFPYKTKPGNWSGGFALSIPKGAANPEAAWAFIKCATGQAAQTSWARDTYALPANQAAANDPTLTADPNWRVFIEALGTSTGGNYLASYPNWKEQFDQRIERVWSGQLSPEQALEEAQQAVQAEAIP